MPGRQPGHLQKRSRDGHRRVGCQEEHHKRLGDEIVTVPIVVHTPGHADQQSQHEARDIERTPRLEPVHPQYEDIEQREIREQGQRRVAAPSRQNRRQEGAGDAEHSQRRPVLASRQQDAGHAEHGEQHEGRPLAQHAVAGEHEIAGQVEHRKAAPLQRQAEAAVGRFTGLAKAEGDQHHTNHGHQREPQPDRKKAVLDGQLQARCDPEEQQHDADLGERIAGRQTRQPPGYLDRPPPVLILLPHGLGLGLGRWRRYRDGVKSWLERRGKRRNGLRLRRARGGNRLGLGCSADILVRSGRSTAPQTFDFVTQPPDVLFEHRDPAFELILRRRHQPRFQEMGGETAGQRPDEQTRITEDQTSKNEPEQGTEKPH